MKSALLCLVTLLLAFQLASALIPPNVIRQCVDSTQIPAVDLALFYGTDYMMVSQPLKCYITCIFETTGMAKDGKISDDVAMLAQNPHQTEQFKELIRICSNLKVEGECASTFEAYKCWVKKGNI